MRSAVASRYAGALVDLVTSPKSKVDPRSALAELNRFQNALAGSAELKEVLVSPAVPPARKRALVERLAQMLTLSPVVQRFLFVVIDRRRTNIIAEILDAFELALDERLGVVRVDISSARELTPEQRTAVTAALGKMIGKQTRPQYSVDEELIGGVLAKVGSTIYDGSVRGQLEALKERLVAAES